MNRAELDIVAIDIPEDKAAYIASKGVSIGDVYEVFFYVPHYGVANDNEWGLRYVMIGPNHSGRILLAAIRPTEEQGQWRLITAYWYGGSRGQRDYERLAP